MSPRGAPSGSRSPPPLRAFPGHTFELAEILEAGEQGVRVGLRDAQTRRDLARGQAFDGVEASEGEHGGLTGPEAAARGATCSWSGWGGLTGTARGCRASGRRWDFGRFVDLTQSDCESPGHTRQAGERVRQREVAGPGNVPLRTNYHDYNGNARR